MRIILADPNQKTLWALKTLIDEEPGMEVIGEAVNAQQLQAVAEMSSSDLVLLDKKLPGAEIEQHISALRALQSRIVIVGMSSNNEDSRIMLKAGADAFLSKGERPDWLLTVLRQYASRLRGSNEKVSG